MNDLIQSPSKKRNLFSLLKHQRSKSNDANDPNSNEFFSPVAKKHKKSTKLQARDIKDLDSKDSDGRNILHRAAVEQNHKYICGVIQDYEIYLEHDFSLNQSNIISKQDHITKEIKKYINQLDDYLKRVEVEYA